MSTSAQKTSTSAKTGSASTSQAPIAASVRWALLQPPTAGPAKVGPCDSNSFPSWVSYSTWNHKKGWNGLHLDTEYTAHAAHIKVVQGSVGYFAEWIRMKAAFISYEVFLAKSQHLQVWLIPFFFFFLTISFFSFFCITKWMTCGKTIELFKNRRYYLPQSLLRNVFMKTSVACVGHLPSCFSLPSVCLSGTGSPPQGLIKDCTFCPRAVCPALKWWHHPPFLEMGLVTSVIALQEKECGFTLRDSVHFIWSLGPSLCSFGEHENTHEERKKIKNNDEPEGFNKISDS